MIIRSIRLSNFGVYAGDHEIQPVFSRDGSGPCITLIGGMNGGGKTSLLDAVLLALYGSQSPSARGSGRSYSAYLESLINRRADRAEGSWVELTLELPSDGGSNVVVVRRSWHVANVRAVERLEISRDGQADELLAEAWDSYVEELIPSGLADLVFFDGEKIGALAEADDTPESVQRSIRSMLGLDLVDRLIADLAGVARRAQIRSRDGEARSLFAEADAARNRVRSQREQLKQEIAQLTSELKRAEDLLKRQQEEYLRAGGAIAESRSDFRSAQEKVQTEYAETRAHLTNLAASGLPLLLVRNLLAQARTRVKSDDGIRQAQAALPLMSDHFQSLTELANRIRGVRVREMLLDDMAQRLKSLQDLAKSDVLFPLSPVAVSQLEELTSSRLQLLREEALSSLGRLREASLRRDQVERYINTETDDQVIAGKLRELSESAQRIAGLKERLTAHNETVRRLDMELRQIDSRIAKASDKLVQTEEAGRIAQHATRSRETMLLFREHLTTEKINHLTRLIGDAFTDLTHKTTLVNSIKLNPDTLRVSLISANGDEVPKARLSSGEKQMLAVAILWGLAKASGRKLPVIVDTPMGRLDSSHRMNFVTRYLPAASHQVIVLSTDTEIVGTYLDSLSPNVGREYLLEYDDAKQQTTIAKGYFALAGGAAS